MPFFPTQFLSFQCRNLPPFPVLTMTTWIPPCWQLWLSPWGRQGGILAPTWCLSRSRRAMPTCPCCRASMKGVTPQLSLLSPRYWHLQGRAGQTRTQLGAPPKSPREEIPAAGIENEIDKAHPYTMDKAVLGFGGLGNDLWGFFLGIRDPVWALQIIYNSLFPCTGSRE